MSYVAFESPKRSDEAKIGQDKAGVVVILGGEMGRRQIAGNWAEEMLRVLEAIEGFGNRLSDSDNAEGRGSRMESQVSRSQALPLARH